jgi:hypothetical protein
LRTNVDRRLVYVQGAMEGGVVEVGDAVDVACPSPP